MGYVIGIFSAKGGVGKSLLATNLAVAFGVGHHRRTVIVDLNPGLGTADLLLDLEPEHSWSDLVSVLNELSLQHLKLAVTEYRPGVDILACPPAMTWKQTLTRKNISSLLEVFREEYDLIVLDTSPGGGGVNEAAYSLADLRLITLTPDAPVLRATKRYLESSPEKEIATGLIINQHTSGAAVSPDEIKEYLGERLFAVLPMDPAGVWANISYGDPCVLRKTSKLGKSIRQLAVRLLKMIDQRTT
jgi:pilus assembly protein CpaE